MPAAARKSRSRSPAEGSNAAKKRERSASRPRANKQKALPAPPSPASLKADEPDSFLVGSVKLAVCATGLMGSYLLWGILQEGIMKQSVYQSAKAADLNNGKFPSALFLVFSNKITAILIASAMVSYKSSSGQLPSNAPFYKYAPASLSNVVSSWAQSFALNFVPFPTQVVFKSSKVIPVMLVGKYMHGKTHELIEYIEAAAITFGIGVFVLLNAKSKKPQADLTNVLNPITGSAMDESATTAFGMLILCLYVLADSFTSQWQKRVFNVHKVDQFQMMLGVNAWSIIFTCSGLLTSGAMWECISFLGADPQALRDVITYSVVAGSGQLFIFYTIKRFGPTIFTLIMTIRQMVSILTSWYVYGNPLSAESLGGAAIVFAVAFYKARRNYLAARARELAKKDAKKSSKKKN